METKNILIIEDQECPLEALTVAVERILPSSTYDVARDLNSANLKINGTQYGLIFLDHRMPYEHDEALEKNELGAYSKTLVNQGYGLIPLIREKSPRAIIVGTSSLDASELQSYEKPDFTMSKMWGEAGKELEEIVKQSNVAEVIET